MNLLHLGYVYKDIAKQAEILKSHSNKFKVRFVSKQPVELQTRYKGEDSSCFLKIALCEIDKLGMELLQWFNGNCPHKEFIERGMEGMHHIAFSVDDVESQVEEFKKFGFEILFSGKIGSNQFIYMDTKNLLGTIIEFFGPVKKSF